MCWSSAIYFLRRVYILISALLMSVYSFLQSLKSKFNIFSVIRRRTFRKCLFCIQILKFSKQSSNFLRVDASIGFYLVHYFIKHPRMQSLFVFIFFFQLFLFFKFDRRSLMKSLLLLILRIWFLLIKTFIGLIYLQFINYLLVISGHDNKRALAPILIFVFSTESFLQAHNEVCLIVLGCFFKLFLSWFLSFYGLLIIWKLTELCPSFWLLWGTLLLFFCNKIFLSFLIHLILWWADAFGIIDLFEWIWINDVLEAN